MTTKEKILTAALQLFNKHGISSITVRDIAREVGISHGNLCYHYPNTDSIIAALYEHLVQQFNTILNTLEPNENAFEALRQSMYRIFELVHKYKFLFLHFVEIGRRVPSIKKRHYELIELRKIQIRDFFEIFRNGGYYRKDLPLSQYEFLITQCFVYGDFWLSSSELLYKGKPKDKIAFYVEGYMALFIPYLTEKGKLIAKKSFK
jgi:AcrR family transcriptional regulator